uniref:Uncharacterized protein n=1 Tax=Tanacetum cinerariifolium TaxID=118510 RepID=A0A6L2K4D5_TANCI|nr:hypothetical protein [Tanacetum cinerariifolium]
MAPRQAQAPLAINDLFREESHKGLGSSSGVQKPTVSAFVSKTSENQNRRFKKENILGTGSEAGGLYVFNIESDSQASSPNDDEGEPSGRNIGLESDSDDTAREKSSDNDQELMSSRQSKLPPKLNDYVLDSKASQHMHAPLQSYMDLGLRVLRYLKGTLGSSINFEKSEHMSLKATLFKSSAEAEYRSMAASTYMLHVVFSYCTFSPHFCENASGLSVGKLSLHFPPCQGPKWNKIKTKSVAEMVPVRKEKCNESFFTGRPLALSQK